MTNLAIRLMMASFLSLSFLLFTSCGKDETPTTASVELPTAVLTTYDGALTYTGTAGVITVLDGEAEIKKSGSEYIIEFSDGVPSLTGLNFTNADGSYATVAANGSVAGIVIDGDDLDVGATVGGNTWAFSGSK